MGRSDDGFTLPELLVAITILGIIMVAIAAMITTSFRTSQTVSEQLQGSRAPKMTSRYWEPDAEQATGFPSGGGCGKPNAVTRVATFTSPIYASAFDDATKSGPAPGDTRTIAWETVPNGRRLQLVRTVCDGAAAPTTTVIVSELAPSGTSAVSPAPGRYILTVTVPDRSTRADGTYHFDITGTSQVTTAARAMTSRRILRRDERGVSLVLVLVTLVIFGLIVPVLGQFGSVNGVSGYVLKGNRFDRYAAEAGMQGAIQWAQSQTQRQAGRQGTKCPDISPPTLNATDGPNASRSVTVRCAGFNDNGIPKPTATIPQYALLALGTNTAITLDGGGKLRTSGAWWSNGSIDPNNVAVDAAADSVGSPSGCAGINASPCATGARVGDPDLPIDVPDVIPVDRPVRANRCEGVVNGQMTMPWGLHWDSDTLDWIGDGHCGDVTIHLAPGGPHIFDFEFFGGGRPDWKLVPQGRNATVRIVSDGWAPTGCTSGAGPVLFAGTFVMRLGDGATADLCGADASTRSEQLVSVAQVTPGTTPHDEDASSTPSRWTAGDDQGSLDGFPQSPPNVPASVLAGTECIPNQSAPACDPGSVEGHLHGDRARGTVTMTVPDPVPSGVGAKLTNLYLTIVHRETGNDVDQRHVWISNGLPDQFAQVSCDLTDNGNDLGDSGDNWRRDQYDCKNMSGVPRPYFPAGDLTVTYQVQLDRQRPQQPEPTSMIGLDSVQLTATFQRPTAQQSHPSGNVLQVDSGGAMHTDGMVDLPGGDVQLDFGGATSSTFGRGLIVRTLDASNFPNDATFTPFSLPNGGTYTDRLATFQAFLGTDAQPILTARVRFCDTHPDGAPLDTPQDECSGVAGGPAKILAWDPTR